MNEEQFEKTKRTGMTLKEEKKLKATKVLIFISYILGKIRYSFSQ